MLVTASIPVMAATWAGSLPAYPARAWAAAETSNPALVMVKCALVTLTFVGGEEFAVGVQFQPCVDGRADVGGSAAVGHGGETPAAAYVADTGAAG